jgi:hypothetical protein
LVKKRERQGGERRREGKEGRESEAVEKTIRIGVKYKKGGTSGQLSPPSSSSSPFFTKCNEQNTE